MRQLIDKLNEYTKLYDEGKPSITDKEWDELYFKLVEMEKETGIIYPDSPTQTIIFATKTSLEKAEHNHPMLSLPKTKNLNEIATFIGDKKYIAMIKCDGLTCSLRYLDGRLVSAETRGNGIIGEDILHNASVIPTIPKTIPYKEELIVDGEIVCLNTDFLEFVGEYRNPRNFAAGSIRLLDAKESSQRKLTFVLWDVIKGFEEMDNLSTCLLHLQKYGFKTVPFTYSTEQPPMIGTDANVLRDMNDEIPMDGIVYKFDSRSYSKTLGKTEHHFNNAMAFKFYDEEYETELKYIEYETSRNGILTPVAVFNPIDIDGSTVERASLHNMSVLEEVLGKPWEGQKLWIVKRNQIIPHVEHAELDDDRSKKYIGDLAICPTCGQPVQRFTSPGGVDFLICSNSNCPSKIANFLDHYCGKSGMDIKGLSKATLEKLLEWGWVKETKDIYELSKYRTEWIKKPGFGPSSVDKILAAIEESKKCNLNKFLVAIGIPLVGSKTAQDIVSKFPTWTDFFNSINENFKYYTLPNFGLELHNAILKFDYTEANCIATNYLQFNEIAEKTSEGNMKDITFVITGKVSHFKNRNELKTIIEENGGKVTDSVSKNTNYLINNDSESNSSKNKTAKKLGVQIITEDEFVNLFLK